MHLFLSSLGTGSIKKRLGLGNQYVPVEMPAGIPFDLEVGVLTPEIFKGLQFDLKDHS